MDHCKLGCGEEIEIGRSAVALPGGLYCTTCGGERALAILDDPRSSPREREGADSALRVIRALRKIELRRQGREKGETQEEHQS